MKRVFITLLALLFTISLASCDKQPTNNSVTENEDVISEEQEEPKKTEAELIAEMYPDGVYIGKAGDVPSWEVWDVLGFSDFEVVSDYDATSAFVTGNFDLIEEMQYLPDDTYDRFKNVVFGDYSLYKKSIPAYDAPEEMKEFVVLDIEVLESDDDYFPLGRQSLIFDSWYTTKFFKLEDMKWYDEYYYDMFAPDVSKNFCFEYIRNLTYNFNHARKGNYTELIICDFVVHRLFAINEGAEGFTKEQICDYAQKYLGLDISDYDFDKVLVDYGQGYAGIGKGGNYAVSTYFPAEERDGITYVTVQFWADYSRIVPAVKIEFSLELVDGEYRYIGYTVLEDTGREVAEYSV